MTDRTEVPNPGSDEAIAQGCRCAVMDNNHGKYPPYPPDGWWITADCPLHGDDLPTVDEALRLGWTV